MADDRRFPVKTYLTAEEVVQFDRIREHKGLNPAHLLRVYLKHGMAKDASELSLAQKNVPLWAGNVRPFGYRRGTQ